MTFRENRLRSGEDREALCQIQLVLQITWKVYRSVYGSRGCSPRVSENIFVILSGLFFVLWTQTNSENISQAKNLVTANEIQVPTKIVRIELLNPFPKIR